MFVKVEGKRADGTAAKRSWHLLAERDDGPLIPSMAVATIVRDTLAGCAPGARPTTRELELDDYQKAFTGRTIYCGVRCDAALSDEPLYKRILGEAWAQLAQSLRDMHESPASSTVAGRAKVVQGAGLMARIICGIFGSPPLPTTSTCA